MSTFEWIVAIGLIIAAVIMLLLTVSFLGFSVIAAALDEREELERGDNGKVGKERQKHEKL